MAPAVAGVQRRGVAKAQVRMVHPNDPQFRTALDACHALALAYADAAAQTGEMGAIGAVRALVNRHQITRESPTVRLMEALVNAAPRALQVAGGAHSAAARFPEFRAWHAILPAVFGITVPDWTVHPTGQMALMDDDVESEEIEDDDDLESEEIEDDDDGEGEDE
jgi:hypothetical protein